MALECSSLSLPATAYYGGMERLSQQWFWSWRGARSGRRQEPKAWMS
jgi:hypothetical protein